MGEPDHCRKEYWTGEAATDQETGRGVSDLVGFSLMFGIIIVSVGIVSVGGVQDILTFGEGEEIQTSQRGMEATASSLEKLNQQGDTLRTFDLVTGGSTTFFHQSELTLTVDGDEEHVPINSLVQQFDRGGTPINVSYEGGGAFRSNFATANYEPSMVCRETHASLSIVNLTTEDPDLEIAVAFDNEFALEPTDPPESVPVAAFAQTVSFDATLVETEVIRADDDINIDVSDTLHPERWEATLESLGWEENGDELECDAGGVIRINTVELDRTDF